MYILKTEIEKNQDCLKRTRNRIYVELSKATHGDAGLPFSVVARHPWDHRPDSSGRGDDIFSQPLPDFKARPSSQFQ